MIHTHTHTQTVNLFFPKSVSFCNICSAFSPHHCLSCVGIRDKAVSFSIATTKLHFLHKLVKKKNPPGFWSLTSPRAYLTFLSDGMWQESAFFFFFWSTLTPEGSPYFSEALLCVGKESVLEFSCQMHFVLWKGTRTLLQNPGEKAPFRLVYLLFLGRSLIAVAILHIGHKHLDSSINWLDFRGLGWKCLTAVCLECINGTLISTLALMWTN